MSVQSVVYRTPRKTSFADGAFLLKIKFIYLSISNTLSSFLGLRGQVVIQCIVTHHNRHVLCHELLDVMGHIYPLHPHCTSDVCKLTGYDLFLTVVLEMVL